MTQGAQYAASEGRSMIIGSAALAAYSFLVCQLLIRFRTTALIRFRTTALKATALAAVAWFAVAFGLRYALLDW
jgi:hypothetical protein